MYLSWCFVSSVSSDGINAGLSAVTLVNALHFSCAVVIWGKAQKGAVVRVVTPVVMAASSTIIGVVPLGALVAAFVAVVALWWQI